MAEGTLWSVGKKPSEFGPGKKYYLRLEKMISEILGTMISAETDFLSFSPKLQKTVLSVHMVGEKKYIKVLKI